jgi:hypothetical protein
MTTLSEKLAAVAAAKQAENTEPEAREAAEETTVDKYVAANGSRRGYQWSGGILRPDHAGIFHAKTREEKNLCEALVVSGQLQSHI